MVPPDATDDRDAPRAMTGACPHCGQQVGGIEAIGPALHTVAPCGRFVDQTSLRELLYGSPPIGRNDHPGDLHL